MIRKIIFPAFWISMVALLLILSFTYRDSSRAMVAVVESQITTISYAKGVKAKKIHVVPGQEIKTGDLILEVERPDLTLDLQRSQNELAQIELERGSLESDRKATISSLESEFQARRKLLFSDLGLERLKLRVEEENGAQISKALGLNSDIVSDSTLLLRISSIEEQINQLSIAHYQEKLRVDQETKSKLSLLDVKRQIVEQELVTLELETALLTRKAEFDGTVGNVYVELNELVAPYTRLVSVYETNPSIIKAYTKESEVSDLHVGDSVVVESATKNRKIGGVISEIGSRITAYPDKVNILSNTRAYGQEIFVKIPVDNEFLNGEKVYVYVKD